MRLELDQLKDFYERCYMPGTDGEKWGRWREIGAATKAEHVARLLGRARINDLHSVLEVGCGDGAVLADLGRRGLGEARVGLDISSTAVELACGRPEISEAHVFDGEHIPAQDGTYDLVLATHVLEHVPSPAAFLDELARVSRTALVIEVPLERNVSARRPSARAASEAAGHLHRFDRDQVREMVLRTGWRIESELLDPLPPAVHTFGAQTPAARAKGWGKWSIRAALSTVPGVAERLLTLHYALLARPE